MDFDLQVVQGPPVQKVAKREDAEAALRSHPQFPKNASVTVDAVNGYWVAAIATPKELVKESAPPPFPPSDDAPAGPPTDEAPEDAPDEAPEEAPKEDKKEEPKGEDKGMEHVLSEITNMLTKITDALGLSTPSDSPVPGHDDPAMAGPPAPEGGGAGPDGKSHTVHERSMKPGEAPPGTTPIGSPSFASVADDHPWADDVRMGTKEIHLEDVMGDDDIKTIASELRAIAEPVGYRIDQIRPVEREGVRLVQAKVVKV